MCFCQLRCQLFSHFGQLLTMLLQCTCMLCLLLLSGPLGTTLQHCQLILQLPNPLLTTQANKSTSLLKAPMSSVSSCMMCLRVELLVSWLGPR